MSAFMVSEKHIDALVSLAISGPSESGSQWFGPSFSRECDPYEVVPGYPQSVSSLRWMKVCTAGLPALIKNSSETSGTELGRILWDANAESIKARYPDDPESMFPLEFCLGYEWDYGKWQGKNPTAVEALKLVACFEYQACEFAGWSESEAFRFCQSLKDALINSLPGYNAADWSI